MENLKENPSDYDSEYLCKECGSLLYVKEEEGSNVCVNKDCGRFPQGLEFYDPTESGSPQLYQELDTARAKLLSEMKRCDPTELALYIYEKRKALIAFAIKPGIMLSIPDLLSLGEFLMMLNSEPPNGNEQDKTLFESVYQQAKRLTKYLNFIDDLKEGRYIWIKGSGKPKALVMKYLNIISDMQKSYGLVSSASVKDISELFEFEDIQELVTTGVELAPGVDHADFLDSLWPYVLTLRYAFALNYRTAKQYRYECDVSDVAALLSFFLSVPNNNTLTVPISKAERHYAVQPKAVKAFEDFLKEYVSNSEKVPIMARVGDRIIMDRLTLLFFIIYLHGHYEVSGTKKTGGSVRIHKKKEETGRAFEQHLRSKIAEHGYEGPDEPVKVKTFEYDIIKVSETKKRIILVDAKFRDPSPSSISAHTLIQQELLDPNQGLLTETKRQLDRLNFFNDNPEVFRECLNLKVDRQEYEVRGYVVTKHVPLISRYKNIKIVSASDLLRSEL
jgi:hypothetical protein